jgi:nucleoid-associated protein EbfC
MSDDEIIDFGELSRRARQMHEDLAYASDDIKAIQATGNGGSGLVTATVSGAGQLVDLEIDPSAIDPRDPDALAGLVIEAVEAANRALEKQGAERIAKITSAVSGLLDGLPRQPMPKIVSRHE